ncbi:MAG: YceI family protein [Planctomycetota bacterium]
MKNLLAWVGVAALLGWTGAGAAAWMMAKDGLTLVVQEGEHDERTVEADPVALLRDEVASLAADVSALATALETNLGVLDQRGEERTQELSQAVAALRDEVRRVRPDDDGATLLAEVRALRAAVAAIPTDGGTVVVEPVVVETAAAGTSVAEADAPPTAPEEVVEVTEEVATPAAPPKRSSFLAFTLPSDDFRFDERRHWTIDAKLSRVGFDGKSTIHDFTGTTQAVTGTMEFDLAHPDAGPAGSIRVEAATLRTGSEGRDEGMLENLDVANHPDIAFELSGFDASEVDAKATTVTGTARGTMSIRGVDREFSMPVTATVDASRRLSLTGEAVLHLPDWKVPVPNKLGLITMDEDVRVWIAVKAKLDPRDEGNSAQ